jgi:hypothetical protein
MELSGKLQVSVALSPGKIPCSLSDRREILDVTKKKLTSLPGVEFKLVQPVANSSNKDGGDRHEVLNHTS